MLLLVLLACGGVTEDLGSGECVASAETHGRWCGPLTLEYTPRKGEQAKDCTLRSEPVRRWAIGDEGGERDVLVFYAEVQSNTSAANITGLGACLSQ